MFAVALALAFSFSSPPDQRESETLVERADRYCIQPDGDHRLTWHLADRDGYALMSNAEYARLRLPGTGGLRAFSKTEDGVEYRILTAANAQTGPSGVAWFRRCWVSASVYDVDVADREMRTLLGFRHFRADDTFMFAWIPQTDGTMRSVPRRVFMRSHLKMANEEGLRQVSVKQYQTQVFIGYASPRDEATYRDFDWSGPEPMAAPE